jgi:serine/threonine protein kinase
MTDPEITDALLELLDRTLADMRAGRTIDLATWREQFPEHIGHLPKLLETVQALETAVEDWRSAATLLEAFQQVSHEPVPTEIGRFKIECILGWGGMGLVFKAHDPQLDRAVAVKVPHFDMPPSAKVMAVQRFLREAKAAARVRHPNVCPMYDVGEADGRPYVVMAFIEGQSLKHLLKSGPLDPAHAADLVAKVALGLEAVHKEGIVHRDVKPANIMLDAAGHPYLTDFGLARPISDKEALTQQGIIVGTPAFMAPEQAQSQTGPIGPWTDVFSLGMVLYNALAGQLPLTDGLPALLLSPGSKVPPPSKHRPGLDAGLEAIVLKAIAQNPRQRYQSAAGFAQALQHWLTEPSGPAVVAPEESNPAAERQPKPEQQTFEFSGLPGGQAVAVTVPGSVSKVEVSVTETKGKKSKKRRWLLRVTVATSIVFVLLALLLLNYRQDRFTHVNAPVADRKDMKDRALAHEVDPKKDDSESEQAIQRARRYAGMQQFDEAVRLLDEARAHARTQTEKDKLGKQRRLTAANHRDYVVQQAKKKLDAGAPQAAHALLDTLAKKQTDADYGLAGKHLVELKSLQARALVQNLKSDEDLKEALALLQSVNEQHNPGLETLCAAVVAAIKGREDYSALAMQPLLEAVDNLPSASVVRAKISALETEGVPLEVVVSHFAPQRSGVAFRMAPDFNYGAIAFMLDCSGSMFNKLNGKTRWEDALLALDATLQTIPESTYVSLSIFLTRGDNPSALPEHETWRAPRLWKKEEREALIDKLRALKVRQGVSPIARAFIRARDEGFPQPNVYRGLKLIVALTDGDDTWSIHPRPMNANANNQQVRALLERELNNRNTEVHVVCFNEQQSPADKDEARRAEEQFKIVEEFKTPGTFRTQTRPRELADSLDEAIRPRLRLYSGNELVKGFTREGVSVDRFKHAVRWHAPLEPGLYTTWLPEEQKQDIHLQPGDFMILNLHRDATKGIHLKRDLFADLERDYQVVPSKSRGTWTASVLRNQIRPRGDSVRQLLAIEETRPPADSLGQRFPGLLWLEVKPTAAGPPARIAWHRDYSFPAPAVAVTVDGWAFDGGKPVSADLRVWWTTADHDPAYAVRLNRDPEQSLKANFATGIPLRVGNTTCRIEDVALERHDVAVGDGDTRAMPCLVFRIHHQAKRPVHVRLRAALGASLGEEHRYDSRTKQYTAVFWNLPDIEKARFSLDVVSLHDFKTVTEPLVFSLPPPTDRSGPLPVRLAGQPEPAPMRAKIVEIKKPVNPRAAGATVKGTVVWRNVPQPNLEVSLFDVKGKRLRTTRTNSAGAYALENVPPGNYSVMASKINFMGISAVSVPQGQAQVENQNIEIKRR